MENFGVINAVTGIYTMIEHAKKGNTYACMKCHEPVIVRIGQIRLRHYAHAKNSTCQPKSSSEKSLNLGETDNHYQAKLILKNCIDMKRSLRIMRSCTGMKCSKQLYFVIPTEEATQTKLEHRLDSGTCDVFMKTEDESYVFEVFNSHRTLAREGIWFEIDAKTILTRYCDEGDVEFPCMRFWKCEECTELEKKQAAEYERTRKIVFLKEYYRLDFGKYKGKDFRNILEEDPLYYKWVLGTTLIGHDSKHAQNKMRIYLREWKASFKYS